VSGLIFLDANNGRMAFRVASNADPLLSSVHAMGDIKPVGMAKASASVLAPAISV
jgi:hypothetical protein